VHYRTKNWCSWPEFWPGYYSLKVTLQEWPRVVGVIANSANNFNKSKRVIIAAIVIKNQSSLI
jgi:hypothetical protein